VMFLDAEHEAGASPDLTTEERLALGNVATDGNTGLSQKEHALLVEQLEMRAVARSLT